MNDRLHGPWPTVECLCGQVVRYAKRLSHKQTKPHQCPHGTECIRGHKYLYLSNTPRCSECDLRLRLKLGEIKSEEEAERIRVYRWVGAQRNPRNTPWNDLRIKILGKETP